jgi:hypothetical protein
MGIGSNVSESHRIIGGSLYLSARECSCGGSEENVFVFFKERHSDMEPMVALLWEDDIDGQILARNFEDFIFRTMVESTEEYDREQTDSKYRESENPAEAYRADILRDLETIRPFLRPEYIAALEDLYLGTVARHGSPIISKGHNPQKNSWTKR